jgi:hypothetical protein
VPVKPKVPKTPPPEDAAAADTSTKRRIEVVNIEFRGQTFTIPRDMDEWDIEACLAMGKSNYAEAAKLLLGTGQWTLLKALGSNRKNINEFLVVFGGVVKRECNG